MAFMKAGCLNSKVTPKGSDLTMFTIPDTLPNPFTSKICQHVCEARNEEGEPSALREEESTSLLFPGGLDFLNEVTLTFSTWKLKPNCASRQLGEDLYKIPETLLKTEYESWKRLQITLSSCTILELSIWENSGVGLTKVALNPC